MSKRAGSTWRVLAQGPGAKRFEARVKDGRAADSAGSDKDRGADFDELVVDGWFHIERMDTRRWWMRVYANNGDDLIVWVDVDKDGRAKRISVMREEAVFTPERLAKLGKARRPSRKAKRR
jgi:hypothetical protein